MQLLTYLIAGGVVVVLMMAGLAWFLNRKINNTQIEIVDVVSKKFEGYDAVIAHHDSLLRKLAGNGYGGPPRVYDPRKKPIKKEKHRHVKEEDDGLDAIVQEEMHNIDEGEEECDDEQCSVTLKTNPKKSIDVD